MLKMTEHKSIQTDRVILVPGPDEEVETVRWMYQAFIEEGKKESELALILNRKGILTDFQRPWTRATVHEVLTNEKYIGNNVYHRTSCKLKRKHVENPPEMVDSSRRCLYRYNRSRTFCVRPGDHSQSESETD